MKSGSAVGPDDLSVEVWKCRGEVAVEFDKDIQQDLRERERERGCLKNGGQVWWCQFSRTRETYRVVTTTEE